MPKIKYLSIRFSNHLFPNEIPLFRAAVIEKTQRASDLFHNHKDDSKYFFRYPLIQYKINRKKASIVCLQDGTDEIHQLLKYRDLVMHLAGKKINFEIEDVNLHYHQLQLWDKKFHFSIHNWLALNQKHHDRYQELKADPDAQKDLLESILKGNILAMAKGIGWHVEERIQVEITEIKETKYLPFKRHKLLAFSVNFISNVSLPDYIGLGKGSSIGFGIIRAFYPKQKQIPDEQKN